MIVRNIPTPPAGEISSRLNVARWEARKKIFAPNVAEIMALTSTDDLTKLGENQSTQLKDVRFSVFLPTCSSDGIEQPDQRITPILGLYHTYTFFIEMNGGRWEFPVVFNKNVDTMISRLWMAVNPAVTQQINVYVRQDFIDPDWAPAQVTLAAILEFNVFTNTLPEE